MKASARNSGHFVQGHVDGVGTIAKKWVEGDSLWIRVAAPPAITRYLVPKGYVAVDGTSLTVCDVNVVEGWFTFMLVEYTQKHIVVPLKPADGTGKVNSFSRLSSRTFVSSARSALDIFSHSLRADSASSRLFACCAISPSISLRSRGTTPPESLVFSPSPGR